MSTDTTVAPDFANEPLDVELLDEIASIADGVIQKLKEGSSKEELVFKTGKVAQMAGRTPAAILRLYDPKYTKNPLPEPQKNSQGHRVFTLSDVIGVFDRIRKLPALQYNSDQGVKILAFLNYKGGAAKSTSAIHQAHYLAKKGYRVLLVDLDPQGTTTSLSGFTPDYDFELEDTLAGLYETTDAASFDLRSRTIRIQNWPNLDLLPSNLLMQKTEFTARDTLKKTGHSVFANLSTALQQVRSEYDVIIIDPPPTLGMLSLSAQVAAEGLIVPLQPQMNDLASTVQAIGLFAEQWDGHLQDFPKPKFIRFLMTNHRGSNAEKWCARQIRSIWNTLVLDNAFKHTPEIQGAAVQFSSIYELTQPVNSPETYRRAMYMTNAVCEEIEDLIVSTWETKEGSTA